MRLPRLAACLAAIICLVSGTVGAQQYPVKPVRLVVPFVPGGNTDIIARIVAPEMSKALGQQLVIENRGGAGSTIGTEVVAKAPADGYTLLMVSAAHVINPAMIKKLPYDSIKDFAPVSIVADVPTAFAVHPTLPVKNVKEFIALAKARPGELNYSTAGRGTVGHLSAELLSSMTNIKMVHVAYKGTGQSIIDLVAGHVQLQFSSMPAVINHARAGKLRLLAQTGEKRSAAASGHRSRPRCAGEGAGGPGRPEQPLRPGRGSGGEYTRSLRRVQQGRDRKVDQGRAHGGHRARMTRDR